MLPHTEILKATETTRLVTLLKCVEMCSMIQLTAKCNGYCNNAAYIIVANGNYLVSTYLYH